MDWIGTIGTLGGAALGFLGGMWISARQRGDVRETLKAEFERQANDLHQQREITAATASAGYAQRTEEFLRPSFDDVLAAARAITAACNAYSDGIGDIPVLDRCIDRFESSPVTTDLARACVEMRVLAAQYRAAIQGQQRLIEGMPRDGAPLDPRRVLKSSAMASTWRNLLIGLRQQGLSRPGRQEIAAGGFAASDGSLRRSLEPGCIAQLLEGFACFGEQLSRPQLLSSVGVTRTWVHDG